MAMNTTPAYTGENLSGYNSMQPTTPTMQAPVTMDTAGVQTLSHGGRVPHGMIAVHMSPAELDVLDHQQGHRKYLKDSDIRMYPDLDAVYKNVHMKKQLVDHARAHYAAGGHVGHSGHPHERAINPHNGRYGDTEVAYIGPHMRHVFDEALGNKISRNPYDGHREYFNLWNFLGGVGKGVFNAGKSIWNMASPIVGGLARSALPMVGDAAGGLLGTAFGPEAGAMASGAINSGGNALLNNIMPQGPMNEFQSNANDAINQGMQNYNQYRAAGNPVNNIADFMKSQGGAGGMARTGAGLGASFLRSNPQMAPGEGANPLMKMGYNLASKYNQIAANPPPSEEEEMQGMGGDQQQQQQMPEQHTQMPEQMMQQQQQPQMRFQGMY